MNILDLPEEVALHIFSYLSANELSNDIAKVCTLWREYSSAFQLWKYLDYTIEGGTSRSEQESIFQVFQTASAFHKLVLNGCENVDGLLQLLCLNCSSIKELVICGDKIDPSVLTRLSKQYKDSICALTLDGMKLNHSWYSAISEIAKGLLTLTVKADCCVWAMGLLSVECTALTCLRLTSCRQTEDLRHQLQGVKRMLLFLPDGLKTLQLGAHISLNAEIMKAIGEKHRLATLTLEDCCEIWDKDLMSLSSLHHLECLQLWRIHKVTSTALLNFFWCSRFNHLKQLDLFDCRNLSDEVLQEICIKCGHLKSLDISSCHLLTDTGIAHVFQLCSELDTLKMSYLPQPTGLGYLDRLSELLPKLIYLDAYNCCNISSDLLSSLENSKLIVMFGRRGRRLNR